MSTHLHRLGRCELLPFVSKSSYVKDSGSDLVGVGEQKPGTGSQITVHKAIRHRPRMRVWRIDPPLRAGGSGRKPPSMALPPPRRSSSTIGRYSWTPSMTFVGRLKQNWTVVTSPWRISGWSGWSL